MPKGPKTFHAIVFGYETGIFRGHFDAPGGPRGHVDGFSNAVFQGFYTFPEAWDYYVALAKKEPDYIEWFELAASAVPLEMLKIHKNYSTLSVEVQDDSKPYAENKELVRNIGFQIDTALIGFWGEELTYNALIKRHGVKKVVWHNAASESNNSPDITVTTSGVETYWEVKTTTNDHFKIHMTKAEKRYAISKRDRYHLMRVIKAGGDEAAMYDCGNPFLGEALAETDSLATISPPSLPPVSFLSKPLVETDSPAAIFPPSRPAISASSILHRRLCGFGECRDQNHRVTARAVACLDTNGTGKICIYHQIKRTIRYIGASKSGLNVCYDAVQSFLETQDKHPLDVELLVRGGTPHQKAEAIAKALYQTIAKI